MRNIIKLLAAKFPDNSLWKRGALIGRMYGRTLLLGRKYEETSCTCPGTDSLQPTVSPIIATLISNLPPWVRVLLFEGNNMKCTTKDVTQAMLGHPNSKLFVLEASPDVRERRLQNRAEIT